MKKNFLHELTQIRILPFVKIRVIRGRIE